MRPLVRDGGVRQREYVANRAKPGMSNAERILMHVKTDSNGCWVWQLALVPRTGYGSITIDWKVYRAHRVSYEAFVGPIATGLELDHLCRNRACVNPDHLEPVTPKVNNNRSPFCRARITHCPHGHEYSEENTYLSRANRRSCRTCRRVYLRLFNHMSADEKAARKAVGLPVVDLAAHFANLDRKEAA